MPRFENLEFGSSQPADESEGLKPIQEEHDQHYWLRQADQERRQGAYENALRFYSRALELDRALVAGWVGQVQMLVTLGEFPEAELWSRKALELFRNHPELLAGRAQALCRTGEVKAALALCDGALGQPGQSSYRWLVRGELMIASKQDVDRLCFDKAVLCDPDWLVPLESALIYLYYNSPAKAQMRIRQALEKATDSAYCWFIQGKCERALGLDERARHSFRRCLELSPRHLEAQRHLTTLDRGSSALGRWWRRWWHRS